jgi:membrane protein DedA with SNARE-associated domain/rhodanese-related sulfurtransferase
MSTALALLVQHGYVVLFAWVAVEQLGLPLPSSPLMIAAGALSATGPLNAGYCVAAVTLGCVVSDTAWYFVGRKYGHRVLRVICMISFEPATCVRKTEQAMGKYGGKTLLVAKFIPGLNVVAAPIAGESGVPFSRFILMDTAGALAWALTFVALGRLCGASVASAGLVVVAERFAVVAFAAVLIGLLARRMFRHHRFHKEADSMRVTAGDLKQRIDAGDRFHIVDLRPAPRSGKHEVSLPGAHRETPAQVLANLDKIPRDRDVVIFCGCPGEIGAAHLAMKLRKHGIDRVHPLEGGIDLWQQEGFPLI